MNDHLCMCARCVSLRRSCREWYERNKSTQRVKNRDHKRKLSADAKRLRSTEPSDAMLDRSATEWLERLT